MGCLLHAQLRTWTATQARALTNRTSNLSVRRPVLNPLSYQPGQVWHFDGQKDKVSLAAACRLGPEGCCGQLDWWFGEHGVRDLGAIWKNLALTAV